MSKKPTDPTGRPDPYQIDKLAKLPAGLKIGVLQFWMAGASFLLSVLGLPAAFDGLDRLVMLVLVLTVGIEYIQNTVVSWMDRPGQETLSYLTHEISRKSALSLLATFVYSLLVVTAFYGVVSVWVAVGLPTIGDLISESTADPISFGLWYLAVSWIWRKIRAHLNAPIGRKPR